MHISLCQLTHSLTHQCYSEQHSLRGGGWGSIHLLQDHLEQEPTFLLSFSLEMEIISLSEEEEGGGRNSMDAYQQDKANAFYQEEKH